MSLHFSILLVSCKCLDDLADTCISINIHLVEKVVLMGQGILTNKWNTGLHSHFIFLLNNILRTSYHCNPIFCNCHAFCAY